ncbi:MAG: hypothetical protein GKR91_14400 [Pseudomonadales bacterium]|nr:hypothetical protein [Pseudomonadales bacterium]
MKNLLKNILINNPLFRLGLFGILFSLSLAANGQNLSTPRTGTIQVLESNEGYFVISGVQYEYDREVIEITLQGEEFRETDLEPGMVLRFRVRGRMLATIEVLGPLTLLERIDEH